VPAWFPRRHVEDRRSRWLNLVAFPANLTPPAQPTASASGLHIALAREDTIKNQEVCVGNCQAWFRYHSARA